jgi:hypothetical protein
MAQIEVVSDFRTPPLPVAPAEAEVASPS